MASPSFTRFLARSLALLEDEQPRAYRLVSRQLAGREVAFRVDEERVFLRSIPPRLGLAFEALGSAVELHATRSTILALAEGRMSLLDAVLSGDMHLQGTVEDLIAFHDALTAYLKGAMRCAGFSELRDEYLREPAPIAKHSMAATTNTGGLHVQ